MAFQERQMQSLFTKDIKSQLNTFKTTAAWELKITKKPSLPFSRLEGHQEVALLKAKHSCVYHKISDQSLGFKPFDAFQICYSPAFVVVLFYTPRKPKIYYWIDIDDWVEHVSVSPRRSLTQEAAEKLASYTKIL